MNLRVGISKEQWLALALIGVGVIVRLLPHPQNFTPVTALAIFSGVTLGASVSIWVPFLVMVASDIIIGHHDLYWATWGSFALVSLLGIWISRKPKPLWIAGGTVAGTLIYFVLTNFAVFAFENMYPKTWAGFIECYLMALPFLKNSLLGDLFYSASVFGLFYLAKRSLLVKSNSIQA